MVTVTLGSRVERTAGLPEGNPAGVLPGSPNLDKRTRVMGRAVLQDFYVPRRELTVAEFTRIRKTVPRAE